MTLERFSNLTVLFKTATNREQSHLPLPLTLKEVVTGPRTLKTAPRALQYGEDAFITRNTEVSNRPCRGDDRRRTFPNGSHDYIYLLNKDKIVAVVIAI